MINAACALTPWQIQIMMLSVRRPDPDAAHNAMTPGQQSRAEGRRRQGEIALAKTHAEIQSILRATPGITTTELARRAGISKGYAHECVHQMAEDGTIRREHGPCGARPLYLAGNPS